MSLINVRRDVSDAFYRYKMERLQTKIEGKGNGIKTVIPNVSSVGASLARPASFIIKYFGFELGAMTNHDPKDDRWIINGAHEASKLQDHLDGFINKFVLCKSCKNPETDVKIENERILLDCKACGQRTMVDLRLKLSGYILKNQPSKKNKKDKAERRAAKKAKQNGTAVETGAGSGAEDGSENGSNENDDDNGDAGSDQEFNKMQAETVDDVAVEVRDDEWAVDMSEEAVKARMAQLPGDFKQKLSLGDDDDDGEGGNTVYDEFGDWIQSEAHAKGSIDQVDSIEIYLKAKELGIETKHRSVLVLVQTIFDKKICAQIPKRAGMLKQVCILSHDGNQPRPKLKNKERRTLIVPSQLNANKFYRSSAPTAMKRPFWVALSVSLDHCPARIPTCCPRLSRSSSCTTITTSSARKSSPSGALMLARSTLTRTRPVRFARQLSLSSTGLRRLSLRRTLRKKTTSKVDGTSDSHCFQCLFIIVLHSVGVGLIRG